MPWSTNKKQVEQWVTDHAAPLYRFAYRLTGSSSDAEDLVQETFLIAQQKRDQLRDESRALPWLLTILRHCRAKQFKQPRLTETVSLDDLPDGRPTAWLDDLDKERLFAVIAEMPDDFREPLLLFYMHDLRYREIAEIVDCPIGTVMSRLARAKSYLRGRMIPEEVGLERRNTEQGETHG